MRRALAMEPQMADMAGDGGAVTGGTMGSGSSAGSPALSVRGDRAGRRAADTHDPERLDSEETADAAGDRRGNRLGHSSNDRPIRPLRKRQAALTLLRSLATQRLQWRASGRRGPDQGRRRAAASDDDRAGTSA